MFSQIDDVGLIYFFFRCLEKFCRYTLQYVNQLQGVVIGICEFSICEKIDIQVDRFKCYQLKVRVFCSLVGVIEMRKVVIRLMELF